jgi:hypothetical protein
MSQYGCQPSVGSQLVEVVQTVSAHAVEHHEALYESGFVVTAIPLLDVNVARHALCDAERAQRLDEHRRSAVGG